MPMPIMDEKLGDSYKGDTRPPSDIYVSAAYPEEKDVHDHLQQKDEDLAVTTVGDHGTHRVLVSPRVCTVADRSPRESCP